MVPTLSLIPDNYSQFMSWPLSNFPCIAIKNGMVVRAWERITQLVSYSFVVLETRVGCKVRQEFASGNTHAALLEGVHYILHHSR